jgi:hypothetical protein
MIPTLQRAQVQQSNAIVPLSNSRALQPYQSNQAAATSREVNAPIEILDTARTQYQKGQAIGQGLQEAGSNLARIAMAGLEAKNYADLHEAKTKADSVMGEHLEWRMKHQGEPGRWAKDFEERFTAARGALDAKPFAPVVKDQLKLDLDSMFQAGRTRTLLDATKAEVDRGVAVADAVVQTGVRNGDMAQVEEGLASFSQFTGEPAEVTENRRQIYAGKVGASQLQAAEAELVIFKTNRDFGNAAGFVEGIEKPEGVPEKDFDLWKRGQLAELKLSESADRADQIMSASPSEFLTKAQRGEFDALPKTVQLAKIKEAEQLRETLAGNETVEARRMIELSVANENIDSVSMETLSPMLKEATPWHREQVREQLEIAKLKGPVGSKQAIAKLYSKQEALMLQAKTFQPTGDADADNMRASRIRLAASSLPADLAKPIDDALTSIMDGDPVAVSNGAAMAVVKQNIELGGLGPRTVPVLSADGKQIMREAKEVGEVKGFIYDTEYYESAEGPPITEQGMIPLTELNPVVVAKEKEVMQKIEKELNKQLATKPDMTEQEKTALALKIYTANGGSLKMKPQLESPLFRTPALNQNRTSLDSALETLYKYAK